MPANKLLIITLLVLAAAPVSAQFGPRDQDTAFAQTWLAQVQADGDTGVFPAAAMVARVHEPALAERLITAALDDTDADPLLLSTAILHCLTLSTEASPPAFCAGDTLVDALVTLAPDNLESYLYALVQRVATGRPDQALAMLNRALEAARHDIYYDAKTALLMEALTAAGYPADDVRYPAEVYAGAADNYRLFTAVLSVCRELSVTAADWKLGCLFLGARMNIRSEALMAVVFGGAIQREVLVATNADADVIAMVNQRNQWVNSVRDLANDKVDWSSNTATVLDQPESFIEERTEGPEFEAILRAIYRAQ